MSYDSLFTEGKISASMLNQRQKLPLDVKILYTKRRVRDFYDNFHGKVYVSFSGGKDSTVLLHIAREVYPDIPAVFVDTGLEYPEIRHFVDGFDGVVAMRPKKSFKEILDTYGYPVINKQQASMIHKLRNHNLKDWYKGVLLHGITKDGKKTVFKLGKKWQYLLNAPFKISDKCCDYMKKEPFKRYVKENGRHPIIGTMASDSQARKMRYMDFGCNVFTGNNIKSTPMGFWTTDDVWQYIWEKKIPYCKIYDMGVHNTGCIFCMFGVHLENEPNRFQMLEKTHPQLHKYCIEKLGLGRVLAYMGISYTNTQQKLEKFK